MVASHQCDHASETLAQVLVQVMSSTQPLDVVRAVGLVRAAALALDRFHARQAVVGMAISETAVHGALTPAMFVMREDDGMFVRAAIPDDRLSADARAYWSPQRRGGEPARASDDLYALGLIAEAVFTAAEQTAPTTNEHSVGLLADARMVMRPLTALAPAARPTSGAEVARDLDRILVAAILRPPASGVHPDAHPQPQMPAEPSWAAASRVAQARRAHRLAQTLPPRPLRPHRPAQVRAPLGRGHYPDMPLPLGWVAAIVIVLCSVYLLPLYFMLFPAG
jgi:hypothetical protein